MAYKLTEFLYPTPAKRKVGSIVGWWEKRRLGYNVIVGAAGLVTLGFATLVNAFGPFGPGGGIPWIVPVVFGVAANVCYTLGPLVEIVIEKLFRGQVLPTGPVLYRMGLTFSVGLALLPTLILSFALVVATVVGLF